MIISYTGLPGSGKSYHVVADVLLPAFKKKGTRVFHNVKGINLYLIAFDFELDYYELCERVEFLGDSSGMVPSSEKVVALAVRVLQKQIPSGSVIVIDELHNVFNSKANSGIGFKITSEWVEFLSMHRHYGINIFFMTQNADQVEITFRRQTEFEYHFKNMGFMMMPGSYHGSIYHGKSKQAYKRFKHSYKKHIFPYYKSFNSEVTRDEHGEGYKGRSILKPIHVAIAASLIFFLGYMAFNRKSNVAIAGGKNDGVSGSGLVGGGSQASTGHSAASVGGAAMVAGAGDQVKAVSVPVIVGCVNMDIAGRQVAVMTVQGTDGLFYTVNLPCDGRDVGQGVRMTDKELRVMVMSDALFFEKQRLAMKYEAEKAGLL